MATLDFRVKNGLVTGANNTTLGTAVTVLLNGNLGVGDTNPAQKLSVSGTLNATGAITQAGNQVLHAANFNTYTPTLTGAGASGTWGINITGNAETVDGFSASTSATASTVVARDGSNYVYFNYINSNTSNGENPTVSQIIVTNGADGFYRKAGIGHLTSAVQSSASGNWGINSFNITQYPLNQSVTTTASPTFAGLTTTGNLVVAAGDLYSYRAGGTTGVIFLNSAGSRYLYWDNSVYTLHGAELNINGQRALNAGNYNNYAVARTSTNRNGVIRLFRNDSDDAYNIQTTWSVDRANHWSLRGYLNDTYHAPCYVAYSGYSDSTGVLATARTFTIGNTGKSFNGGGNVSWSLSEIGAPSTTGVGASGNWDIQAAGLYTTQSSLGYSVNGVNIDFGGQGGPQIRNQGGGAAMISFHREGAYAINFGLGTDNQLRTGGWSRGGNHVILDSGNYNSYAPTLTGGNASGNWNIRSTNYTDYGGANQDIRTSASPTFNNIYASVFRSSADGNTRLENNVLALRGGSPTIYFRDTDSNSAMLHCNGNLFYILRGGNDTETWTTVGSGSWPMTVNLTNNDVTWGGNLSAIYNITAYASDRRLKENIKEIPNALEKIMAIRGVTFDWNDVAEQNGFIPQTKYNDIGCIAQEVQAVLPHVVTLAPFDKWVSEPGKEYTPEELEKIGTSKSGENYLTIQYERIVPLLIQAIKEQQAQIDELRKSR